jgi:hypothetical protein
MDKQTIYKFIAIAVAAGVLFLGDILLFGSSSNSGQQPAGQYMIGILEANYTLESYKGIVQISNPSNFSEIRQNISGMPGVKKVYENPDAILITTENENVSMEIYRLADGKYGKVFAKAVLAPEGTGILNNTYDVNVSLPLEVYLKPTIKTGSRMAVIAEVAVLDGSVSAMGAAQIASERKRIDVVGRILNVSETLYSYEIGFEDRASLADYGNATMEISNTVYLNATPLTKKPYVEWVGDSYIIVNANMTNEAMIMEDYGNATFPSSYLKSTVPLNVSSAKGAEEVAIVDVSTADSPYAMPDDIIQVSIGGWKNATAVRLVLSAEVSGSVVLDYLVIGSSPVYS